MHKRAVRIAAPGIEGHYAAIRLFCHLPTRIDDITADSRILYRAGHMDQRRKHAGTCRTSPATVINTDIVRHNGPHIPGIERSRGVTVVADQHHPAVVIMTMVILDKRVPAIPVRIESLRVPGSLMAAHLIEPDNRIVATPRPDTGGGFRIGKDIRTIAHHVILDQRAIATDRNDAVARDLLDQVFTDYRMFARMPVLPAAISRPDHRVTGTTPNPAILYRQAVENGYDLFPAVDD